MDTRIIPYCNLAGMGDSMTAFLNFFLKLNCMIIYKNLFIQIMPVQPMKDMMSGCQKKLDLLIKCGDIDTKRYEGINHFQRAIDMEIVETVTIPTMADLDPKCCGEACDGARVSAGGGSGRA